MRISAIRRGADRDAWHVTARLDAGGARDRDAIRVSDLVHSDDRRVPTHLGDELLDEPSHFHPRPPDSRPGHARRMQCECRTFACALADSDDRFDTRLTALSTSCRPVDSVTCSTPRENVRESALHARDEHHEVWLVDCTTRRFPPPRKNP